jgi:hypothetical protein
MSSGSPRDLKRTIGIPRAMHKELVEHLFRGTLEEGAFIFARASETEGSLALVGVDLYLVPPAGWLAQTSFNLEMTDEERARVLKLGRDGGLCLVDCHSHRRLGEDVSFSWSDRLGIQEFAPYVRWKLDRRPYAAMVFGESSVDAVMWDGDFQQANQVDEIIIQGEPTELLVPTQSWIKLAGTRPPSPNG